MDWTSTFKTEAVCRIFGVSKRNIQYWTEQKLLKPKIKSGESFGHGGTIRVFSMFDLVIVGVMVGLRKKGLSLIKVRKVMPYIIGRLKQIMAKAVSKVPSLQLKAAITYEFDQSLIRTQVKVRSRTKKLRIVLKVRDILNRIEAKTKRRTR